MVRKKDWEREGESENSKERQRQQEKKRRGQRERHTKKMIDGKRNGRERKRWSKQKK